MKIIIDANIVFAALIKNSTTRWLLLFLEADFYFPEPLFDEIEKYRDLIKKKADITDDEFKSSITKLLEYIKIVKKEDLVQHLEDAEKIMREIDPKDSVILAAALSIKHSLIWSSDKHLSTQETVKTVTTLELIKEYKKQINLVE